MQAQQIYANCCAAIAPLLDAMERGDLEGIERQATLVQSYLDERRSAEPDRGAASESLIVEQLDAIDGLTEAIRRSLVSVSRAARAELQRIRATEPLLRHLSLDPRRLN